MRTALTLVLSLAMLAAIPSIGAGEAEAAKRYIVVTAIEPKGSTNVAKEPFPEGALPPEPGYVLKKPDETGRWEVSVYVFDPRQIVVDEGDEVVLEFVGINGASHPTTIVGYDKTFTLLRGQSHKVSFVADKVGIFPIVCASHHPTMTGELVVKARK